MRAVSACCGLLAAAQWVAAVKYGFQPLFGFLFLASAVTGFLFWPASRAEKRPVNPKEE